MSANNHTGGGYQFCACRDCFDIAISPYGTPVLCGECSDAQCEINAGECQREDAYTEGFDIPEPAA